MKLLNVKNLSAGYGKVTIVKNISFSVNEGELTGIFGENGCGKTTLFRAIAGLGTRISGKVTVAGRDVTAMSVKKRAAFLSMLPPVTDIPNGILADEVLEMGWYARCSLFKGPDAAAKKEKELLIRELGLGSLTDSYFDRLSQGQKQRILLGRMLLQDTPVFLMDEPDQALDFRHKHQLFQRIRQITADRKKAGIMILHDPSLALTYCDRVFLMKDGTFLDVICPGKENAEQISTKINPITGNVRVTKEGTSVIIFP